MSNLANRLSTGRAYQQHVDSNKVTTGYCARNLTTFRTRTNHEICQSGTTKNIAARFEINFCVNQNQTFGLHFQVDNDWGSALFIDGSVQNLV